MTFLQIINQVLNESGFDEFSSIVGASGEAEKQLLALANREVYALTKHPWQILQKTQEVSLVTGTNEYDLPSDFRQYVFDTAYTEDRKAWFPVPRERWAYDVARDTISGRSPEVRLINNKLYVRNPETGITLNLDYTTNQAVLDTDGTTRKQYFVADTDTFLLEDYLLIQGIKWRWKREKGLEFEGDLIEFKQMLRNERATDQNSQTIHFGDGPSYGPVAPYADLYI